MTPEDPSDETVSRLIECQSMDNQYINNAGEKGKQNLVILQFSIHYFFP